MQPKSVARDLCLLTAAAAIGWWAHGAAPAVSAQNRTSASDSRTRSGDLAEPLGFQFGGAGIEGSLTLYNPANRTLYVYPSANGNSHINCAYSFHIDKPGGPIDRENCPVGSAFGH